MFWRPHDLPHGIANDFTVTSSTSSLDHAPESAIDVMFAWKPFLNFIIIYHFSGEAVNPKSANSGSFSFNSCFFSCCISHFTVRGRHSSTLCVETALARSPNSLGISSTSHVTVGNSIDKLSETTPQGPPGIQFMIFSSHPSSTVSLKFKILSTMCSRHLKLSLNTLFKILTVLTASFN